MRIFAHRMPAFDPPPLSRPEAQEIERCFARLFSTEDGRKVLSHLHSMTFMRAAGMDAPDTALRYMEGQRALMASILRMIDRGRQA